MQEVPVNGIQPICQAVLLLVCNKLVQLRVPRAVGLDKGCKLHSRQAAVAVEVLEILSAKQACCVQLQAASVQLTTAAAVPTLNTLDERPGRDRFTPCTMVLSQHRLLVRLGMGLTSI